ncbi:MAG: histidine kinase [Saprospiraceae bacterium]
MNSLIQNVLFLKKWWPLRHLLFWLFIYLDEVLSFIGIIAPYEEYFSVIVSFVFDAIVVYLNLYILIPRFFKNKNFPKYLVFTVLSVVILIGGEIIMEKNYWQEEQLSLSFYIHIFVQTTVTLAAAVAAKVLKRAISEGKLRRDIEKEKLSFELQHLKKQVNPHFLFNVLNGIYIQSQTNHKAVPNTIMQLSDLLRYQIYDAEKTDEVLISKEIEFVKNYIALELMRRENTVVNTQFLINNPSTSIEPLLFIVLIENAFKYSVSQNGKEATIDISIVENEGEIEVKIDNSLGVQPAENDNEGGFGLHNLKKRLELLYPDAHTLEVDVTKEGTFSVKLEIYTNELHHN